MRLEPQCVPPAKPPGAAWHGRSKGISAVTVFALAGSPAGDALGTSLS